VDSEPAALQPEVKLQAIRLLDILLIIPGVDLIRLLFCNQEVPGLVSGGGTADLELNLNFI